MTTDPTDGRITIFSDLHHAFELMKQHLNAAYASRGVVVTDDIEFKETCEEAVGCVVAYILTYARTRTRPVISNMGQSALMQLAERLSDVFSSVGDAAKALHDVETVALEAIAEVLPEHNNFEVVDWQVRLYTLVIFIRLTPTPNLDYTPPSPPDWSSLDWTVQVQPMKDVDADKLVMVMPYDLHNKPHVFLDDHPLYRLAANMSQDELSSVIRGTGPDQPLDGVIKSDGTIDVWNIANKAATRKFYPESTWPKNEKDPQQFGEEFVIYMPGPEPADPPQAVQVEWLDDVLAHPTEPKKVEPGEDDSLSNVSF